MISVYMKSGEIIDVRHDSDISIRDYERTISENKFISFDCANGNRALVNTNEINYIVED